MFLVPRSRSRLKKKPGAGAAWEKNQEPEQEPLEKSQETEQEPIKNLPAFFTYSSFISEGEIAGGNVLIHRIVSLVFSWVPNLHITV